MKTIFLALILFVTSLCSSQTFSVSAEVGQGFKFIDYHNPQFYMVNASVTPSFEFIDGKLNAQSIVWSAFSDGYTYLFAGPGVSYNVFQKNNLGIDLGATALYGSEALQLYGLNAKVSLSTDFYITLNARQEYSRKEFWFDGGVGMKIY